ncbi:hypothetical protein ColLi_05852 [Colletotrichum liriopes]|uniref:Uncharacterized protein n=1 Tax=Colletotrichum liriopes TaxID=708192 RepID=A0AA37GLR2_9PEZI|nr:hypothetical protein ColLi_05852 [Colletotrichum liriopes]
MALRDDVNPGSSVQGLLQDRGRSSVEVPLNANNQLRLVESMVPVFALGPSPLAHRVLAHVTSGFPTGAPAMAMGVAWNWPSGRWPLETCAEATLEADPKKPQWR